MLTTTLTVDNIQDHRDIILLLDRCDRMIEAIDDIDNLSAMEKYNILIRPFAALIDLQWALWVRVLTRIFRFFKIIKRSELRMFHVRYPLKWKYVKNVKYVEVAETEVPSPNGMAIPYYETSQRIKNFFDLVTVEYLSRYKTAMDKLYKYLSTSKYDPLFDPNIYIKSGTELEKDKRFFDLTNKFKGLDNKKKEKPLLLFKHHFNNMQEFAETNANLSSLNEVILQLRKVLGLLNDLHTTSEKTVKIIKDTEEAPKELITKEFVKNLSAYIRSMAETFDMYGTMLEVQMSVEHNYVKIINLLYDNF